MSKFGWSYPPGAANDPNAPYNQDGDEWAEEAEEVLAAMKLASTGRWDWDKIDMCLTGKDADLEPWGDQGVELLGVDDDGIRCRAHIMKTFAGDDVSLNTPWDRVPDDDYRLKLEDAAKEAFLDQAESIMCGCDVPGEWDGDSWVMSTTVDYEVPWVMDGDTPDPRATALSAAKAAETALAPIVAELQLADEAMNLLAGWATRAADGSIIRTPAGHPGREAAWTEVEE